MKLSPVEGSSTISAIGYDAAEQTLHVQFKSGGTYRYSQVPPDAHAALLKATSKGKHFHSTIRGKFKSEPVPDHKHR